MTAPHHTSELETHSEAVPEANRSARVGAISEAHQGGCSGTSPRVETQREVQQELHQVLAALGDPVRLTIVRQLAERGEVPCGGFQFDLAKSTLSHHFKVLRESGVVASRPEGTSLLNCLNREELEKRFPGLLAGVLRADAHDRRSRS